MCESWREYLRERYPLKVFLPVAMGLTLLAFADSEPQTWIEFALCLLAVLTMVFQFRLWDDLGDHPYDRIHHPRRVLSRAPSLAAYWRAVAITGAVNLAFLMLLDRKYLWFAALNAAALLWYGGVPVEWRRSIAGRHFTLLKYPAFVLSVASTPAVGSRLILSMAAVYLCAGIYELFHDGEIRSQPAARRLVAAEMFLLATVAVVSRYAN
jgi:4-hydroxybenzoate polyprenyltransferase